MNQLYKNYTSCCIGKHKTTKINPKSPDDEIRKYMFGEHTQNSTQEIHKAIPYHITDQKIQKAISLSFLETLEEETGIHFPKLKEYIIFHAGLPVDTMSRQELSKYINIPNETNHPRLRQSVA